MLIVFEHQGSRTATWHESVAVTIERARGLLRLFHALGEGPERIERRHAVEIHFLRTAAEHAVLQPLPYHHAAQSNGMTAAGTRRTHAEVHATQPEDATEVHVYRRIHRLKDISRTQELRVVLLGHDIGSLDHGTCRRVVTEDDAHLVRPQVILIDMGLPERLERRHIGILRLLGQSHAIPPVQQPFEPGPFNDARQSALIAILQPLFLHADARTPRPQGLRHQLLIRSQARPYAHARHNHSSAVHHHKVLLTPSPLL